MEHVTKTLVICQSFWQCAMFRSEKPTKTRFFWHKSALPHFWIWLLHALQTLVSFAPQAPPSTHSWKHPPAHPFNRRCSFGNAAASSIHRLLRNPPRAISAPFPGDAGRVLFRVRITLDFLPRDGCDLPHRRGYPPRPRSCRKEFSGGDHVGVGLESFVGQWRLFLKKGFGFRCRLCCDIY